MKNSEYLNIKFLRCNPMALIASSTSRNLQIYLPSQSYLPRSLLKATSAGRVLRAEVIFPKYVTRSRVGKYSNRLSLVSGIGAGSRP